MLQVLLPQNLLPMDPSGYEPEIPGVCRCKGGQQKKH